jgi:hypothetical protein
MDFQRLWTFCFQVSKPSTSQQQFYFYFFDMGHDCQLGIHKLHRANNHHKRKRRFDGTYLRFVVARICRL